MTGDRPGLPSTGGVREAGYQSLLPVHSTHPPGRQHLQFTRAMCVVSTRCALFSRYTARILRAARGQRQVRRAKCGCSGSGSASLWSYLPQGMHPPLSTTFRCSACAIARSYAMCDMPVTCMTVAAGCAHSRASRPDIPQLRLAGTFHDTMRSSRRKTGPKAFLHDYARAVGMHKRQ